MIDDLDRTIERILQYTFGSPLPFELSYASPDKAFGPQKNRTTLDCYLYDIREEPELRRVGPIFERNSAGVLDKKLAPMRIKVSYCMTVWSAMQVTSGMEPAFEEHQLLGKVLSVLLQYPLLPKEFLVGVLQEQEFPLPTCIISPNSSMASRDFWNAIGGQLRPSLDYSVILAVPYPTVPVGPLVTTLSFRSMQKGTTGEEESNSLGGTVVNANDPTQGLASAEVLVKETGQTYFTDKEGRFFIEYIVQGTYTFHAQAAGFKDSSLHVTIPQPDGLYNLYLQPL